MSPLMLILQLRTLNGLLMDGCATQHGLVRSSLLFFDVACSSLNILLDGGVNPPRYYYTHEEIDDTLQFWGGLLTPPPTEVTREAEPPQISPSPLLPTLPLPLTLDLVNSARLGGEARRNNQAVASGHIVNVTLVYSIPAAPTTGRGKAPGPKKSKIMKMDNIQLESISRTDFIKAFLATHGLAETFSPGPHSGPDFKLWWAGMRRVILYFFLHQSDIFHSGGKAGAPSIQTDHQFGIAHDALLKKSKASTIINVEFDVDTMEGFRIKHVVRTSLSYEGSYSNFVSRFLPASKRALQVQRMNWLMEHVYVVLQSHIMCIATDAWQRYRKSRALAMLLNSMADSSSNSRSGGLAKPIRGNMEDLDFATLLRLVNIPALMSSASKHGLQLL
jgi:hypothetical protein